ncbi:Importin subunit alpha-1 [Tulasnella sp. 424]|nr:Importin subunit alpha-1 [Tulasnella sp. 424]KAG8970168.1 Importin subunit alpha-1 [Tulasnella sp. 425]
MTMEAEEIVVDSVQDPADQDKSNNDNNGSEQDSDEEFDESLLDGYVTDENRIVEEIVNGFCSSDVSTQLEAVTKVHRLRQRRESATIQAIITSDLLPAIVDMVSSGDHFDSQVRAASILLSVTGGSSEQTSAAVDAGAIPTLVTLASSSNRTALRNKALLALGNIGGDSQHLRERLIAEGGLKPPLDFLANPSRYSKSTPYWAAHALNSYTYRIEGKVPGYEVTEQMLPVLASYIVYQTDETAESFEVSLRTLGRILADKTQVDVLLKTDVIPRLVHLCTSQEPEILRNALHCVGRIVLFSADGCEQLVNAGILEVLKNNIVSEEVHIRRDACWAASNLVISAAEHTKALIASGYVPILVKVLSNEGEDSGARGGAAWALSSVACNWGQDHHEMLDTLLEANSLEAFYSSLTLKDKGSVEVSLKGILVLVKTEWDGRKGAVERVKAGGGIAQIRAVRCRNDIHGTELHKLAQMILKDYFPEFSRPARI